MAIFAVLAVASGCAQSLAGVGSYSSAKDAPDAKIPIKGLPNGKPTKVDKIAGNAIDEIQKFWTTEFPKDFDGDKYTPVKGGFYSVDPNKHGQNIPCTGGDLSVLQNNAFYCPSSDIVAWDRAGLFPTLDKQFGPFLIAMVLAHEWGHAIQARSDAPEVATIVSETQADCYAGAWTKAVQTSSAHFDIDKQSLDDALGGYLLFRDPVGSSPTDQQAHGNAFDRVSAFQEGFEQGSKHCATAFTDDREFTETPFSSQADQESNGNLPFDQAIDLGSKDIESFWAQRFKTLFGKDWNPVNGPEGYDGNSDSNRPSCDGKPVTRTVVYCAKNNTIYYDEKLALPKVYKKTGDFGPMTLLAVAYGQAIRSQLGKSTAGDDGLAGSICLAGTYAHAASARQPGETQDDAIILSPGDLDEAVQALLTYGGTVFDRPTSAGFTRIKSFREGFEDIKNCGG